jgi:tetratricopeptide (TPR) repeat protein
MQGFGTQVGRRLRIVAMIAFLGAVSSWGLAGEENRKPLVQQAFDLHQKGRFAEALPLLRRAYSVDPDDYFVNLLLGVDSLRTGEPKTAVPFLKKASRLRPQEEFPLDYLGEAYGRQDLYGEAAAAFLKALQVAPGSPDSSVAFVDFALTRFARMSALLRSSQKGLSAEYRLRSRAVAAHDPLRVSLLQRAADLDGAAPGIWSDLALAALEAGDLNGAERYSRQALEADPDDLSASIADAQLAAKKSEWKQAAQLLNSVAQRSPARLSNAVAEWPQQLHPPSSAVVSGTAQKFFTCVSQARRPCDLAPGTKVSSANLTSVFREQRWEQVTKPPAPQPGQTEAWLRRGIAFAQLDDCRQAIPSLERGLSKPASEVYGMFLLSWCYSRQAGATAERVQRSGSDEASVHLMRGDILLRLQTKAALAVSEYQLALAMDPNDPAGLERLADAQFGAGNIEAARQNAQAALKIDGQRPVAKRTIAKIAIQERDYAVALPYLRDLAGRDPQDMTMRIELAKACAQTGALDDARQQLELALAQGYPDEKGSLHYLLGTILKKTGRAAEAAQALATATQLSDAFQQKSYHDQDPDAEP